MNFRMPLALKSLGNNQGKGTGLFYRGLPKWLVYCRYETVFEGFLFDTAQHPHCLDISKSYLFQMETITNGRSLKIACLSS